MKGVMRTNRLAVFRTGPDGATTERRIYVNRDLVKFVKFGGKTIALIALEGSMIHTREVWEQYGETRYECFHPDTPT